MVVSYWPERRRNVLPIVRSMLDGTVPCERVIVLDNWPGGGLDLFGWPDGVEVLQGTANWECRGKFAVPMLAPAEHYVLADDDTGVGARTVEAYLHHLGRWETDREPCVTGYWGVRMAHGPEGWTFMQGQIVTPGAVESPHQVDGFHGRVVICNHVALTRMYEAERRVRTRGFEAVGDDILIGLANRPHCFVLPLRDDEHFRDLDEGGVAMQQRDGYFAERDEFARHAMEVLA